jgi:hypothetical protein
MRVGPMLVLLVVSLGASAAPETSIVTEPVAPLLVSAADEATYQALQSEADLARDMLTQAQGQRLAMAQLPVN